MNLVKICFDVNLIKHCRKIMMDNKKTYSVHLPLIKENKKIQTFSRIKELIGTHYYATNGNRKHNMRIVDAQ